ncbi:MAG: hypothetical protein KPI85_08250 [cyanobacterium endosymbiont of Epithemia adnata isolate EadnSB Bon19]
MYFDDIDCCHCTRDKAEKILYSTEVRVIHLRGKSSLVKPDKVMARKYLRPITLS